MGRLRGEVIANIVGEFEEGEMGDIWRIRAVSDLIVGQAILQQD